MGLMDIYKRIRAGKGQSTLEFAMIAPLIIVVVLAVSQIGLAVYSKMMLQQSAREAARIISTTGSNSLAIDAVRKICGEDTTVIIEPENPAGRKLGDMVNVNVSRKPDGFLKVAGWIAGKEIIIDAKAVMRMECDLSD